MDLSALIFVALAVAWAVYLIPKALRHHDDAQQRRTVEGFSKSIRVLARREPIDARSATLGRAGRRSTGRARAGRLPGRGRPCREASRSRVVLLILAANAAVAGLAYAGILLWTAQAIPAGLLVAWLVACRLMVKKERAARPGAPYHPSRAGRGEPRVQRPRRSPPSPPPSASPAAGTRCRSPCRRTSTRRRPPAPCAPSTSTRPGVWSSGRNESDSALAREADEAARAAKAAERRRPAPAAPSGPPDSEPPVPGATVSPRVREWGCGAVGSASRSQ